MPDLPVCQPENAVSRNTFLVPFFLSLLALPALPAAAQVPADLHLENVVTSGLSSPLGLTHAGDGSGRLFILERGGSIKVVADGALLPTPFMTLTSATPGGFTTGGERGLLGLAFHPEFIANRRFYLNYTGSGGHTKIVEYQVSASDPNVADLSTRRELMTISQPAANHNGGNLLFGPDGYLYIGMGDGGSGNDPFGPHGNSQNLNTLLGKMLRIDVDVTASSHAKACGGSGTLPYGIPADNPFAGTADSYCAEIVHYGLRNPWRWSFDRATGDLWIGDVGQSTREEINLLPAAQLNQVVNFGWRCFEGTWSTGLACPDPLLFPHYPPVHEYPRSGGNCSITGGHRYRGPITGLDGIYMFTDYCLGQIRFLTQTGSGWQQSNWGSNQGSGIVSFGEDEAGHVYVVNINQGSVRRFASAQVGPVLHTVTPVAGAGGSLDPDTPQEVEEGDTMAFDVLADPGYIIDTVTGCGGVLAGTVYTTAPVLADCTVQASFGDDPDLIFRNGFEAPR